jgi:hypothetical protein
MAIAALGIMNGINRRVALSKERTIFTHPAPKESYSLVEKNLSENGKSVCETKSAYAFAGSVHLCPHRALPEKAHRCRDSRRRRPHDTTRTSQSLRNSTSRLKVARSGLQYEATPVLRKVNVMCKEGLEKKTDNIQSSARSIMIRGFSHGSDSLHRATSEFPTSDDVSDKKTV